jgi:hypothetical protein
MKTPTSKPNEAPRAGSAMAEVRRVKTELAKRFGYDISAMLRDARNRQEHSGHRVVNRSMKK